MVGCEINQRIGERIGVPRLNVVGSMAEARAVSGARACKFTAPPAFMPRHYKKSAYVTSGKWEKR